MPGKTTSQNTDLYRFHDASIHERRCAAKICAAVPLVIIVGYVSTLAYAALRSHKLLLAMNAVLNTAMWLWIVTTAILGIAGACLAKDALWHARRQRQGRSSVQQVAQAATPSDWVEGVDAVDKVVHMIVLPNFKEDECVLTETLLSLSEADESESLCVVLAMEQREPYSLKKAERLQKQFAGCFAAIVITTHSVGLDQTHLDDSIDIEVPGKASNLKWAVPQGLAELKKSGVVGSTSSIILTISDADCIFHPSYFAAVTREFNMLRENPGKDYLWTMYQAPQFPFRNFFSSVACCRIWAYVSSTFECGGVCSIDGGGMHMTFSGYSLPLQLALDAGAWDGDVIAEDHHAFLKCFFYSALRSVEDFHATSTPQLKVKPIHLPVKSTSVEADGYWRTCIDRWYQAKRHAQGASELSYVLLATYDALCTLPWRSQSFAFYWQVSRLIIRLFCMHLLPTCQGLGLLVLSVIWFCHGRHLPLCPQEPAAKFLDLMRGDPVLSHWEEYLTCSLAGGWVLVWPMVIVTSLVVTANFMFLKVVFIRERDGRQVDSVWHAQDGGAPHGCLSPSATALLQTAFDCTFLLSLIMVPYGFFANVAAYTDIALYGNRVKYVTASKPTSTTSYGTLRCNGRRRIGQPASEASGDSSSTRESSESGSESTSSGSIP